MDAVLDADRTHKAKAARLVETKQAVLGCTPEWIRTTDRRIRSPVLYPAELRARGPRLGSGSGDLVK